MARYTDWGAMGGILEEFPFPGYAGMNLLLVVIMTILMFVSLSVLDMEDNAKNKLKTTYIVCITLAYVGLCVMYLTDLYFSYKNNSVSNNTTVESSQAVKTVNTNLGFASNVSSTPIPPRNNYNYTNNANSSGLIPRYVSAQSSLNLAGKAPLPPIGQTYTNNNN